MCNSCGCNTRTHTHTHTHIATISAEQRLLADNDQQAEANRALVEHHQILLLNLMSSPGAGKTSLLEATIDALAESGLRLAVIEGDLETANDAQRIRARGAPAVQLSTGSACHLDAQMVAGALSELPLEELDLVFIENVGNLICPAGFDLGQHANVVLLSVTEGDDKPAKYPVMFRTADLMLISKTDLLAVLDDFDPAHAEQQLRDLANPAPVLRLAARANRAIKTHANSTDGIDAWLDWLRQTEHALRQRIDETATLR